MACWVSPNQRSAYLQFSIPSRLETPDEIGEIGGGMLLCLGVDDGIRGALDGYKTHTLDVPQGGSA